mgnify:CR=1 FL=1
MKQLEALGLEIAFGFDLDGNDLPAGIQQKIYFGTAPVIGSIVRFDPVQRFKLLQNILLGQGTVKFLKQGLAVNENALIQTGHARQQADIWQKKLESFEIFIGFERQIGPVDAIDSMNKTAVNQPEQSYFILLGPGPFLEQAIDEFLVFFG